MWMICDVIRRICRPIICTATTSFFVSRALDSGPYERFLVNFFHVQRQCQCLSNAILTFEKFPQNLEIFWKSSIFYLKVSRYLKNFEVAKILSIAVFLGYAISMFEVQIWCLYLVNRLLYGVLPETTVLLTKTVEHDLSLTRYNFWPWVTSDKLFSEDA